jgi:hypothetical protein
MNLVSAVMSIAMVAGLGWFTSNCDNAGVTVDAKGNIVLQGESGFISPNSTLLDRVTTWPHPPTDEQNFAFSQGYTLGHDGDMYVLENTAYHPNLVYHIDLATGRATLAGNDARSKQTWIAADSHDAYSVDQATAAISRMPLSPAGTGLKPYIFGSHTGLRNPLGVAVDGRGRICAIDSETLNLLCYPPGAHGNAAPVISADLKSLLGYAQVDGLTFGASGDIVVSGTSDTNGLRGYSLSVIDATGAQPRVLRTIGGPHTWLTTPISPIVDKLGNILVLQRGVLLAFSPKQSGDVSPAWIRRPPATVTGPDRMAVAQATGDIAILGSDGIGFFPKAAALTPDHWPQETRLPMRGWDVAFSGDTLIVADEYGALAGYIGRTPTKQDFDTGAKALDLHNPEFIATDHSGRIFVASTDGFITALPTTGTPPKAIVRSFATPFGRNMGAFAAATSGSMYLSSSSKSAIITIDPDGRQGLLAGDRTALHHPSGLAAGPDGSLFVANTSGRNILIFSPGSEGNVSPAGEISGPATLLIAPQAIATDAAGNVYVFDGPKFTQGSGADHFVRVFAATARGNAVPTASYPVKTKCWVNAP